MNDVVVYLASPYSHPNREVLEGRAEAVSRIAALLFEAGVLVYSPIAHSHTIAAVGDLPTDFAFWDRYNRAMLERCDALFVVAIPGYDLSVGVAGEMQIARDLEIPVFVFEPSRDGLERALSRYNALVVTAAR